MTDHDPKKNYRELDHTADLSLEIYGGELRDLFGNAVHTLYDLLGLSAAEHTASLPLETVTVQGQDREDALVRLLGELLYRAEAEQWRIIPVNLTLEEDRGKGEVKVRLEGTGQRITEEARRNGYEIKAVTYHQTEIRAIPGGWVARVVMDI